MPDYNRSAMLSPRRCSSRRRLCSASMEAPMVGATVFAGVLAGLMAAAFASGAAAQTQQGRAIYTASEAGAYHSWFCPPIPDAMGKAGFGGYVCTPSGGTPDNISSVLADPR